jgi:hypothetical protein
MLVLDEKLALKAIELAGVPVAQALFKGPANRSHGQLIVGVRDVDGTGSVLATRTFGLPQDWQYPFDAIAEGKFNITVRTGLPSREVQFLHPELIEADDVIYYGSAIVGNIVVAYSGIQAYFDEVIAYAVAYMLRALVQNELETRKQAGGDTYSG